MIEGIQYYLDPNGKWVFTETFHKSRGYCCGNACRHCPFAYEAVPEPVRSRKLLIQAMGKIKSPNAIHREDK